MSVSLSTFTDVSLIDSSASGGTIVLPRAGGIRYRVVVFKDRKGTFQNNPLTLNTLPGDTFEDGTTSKVFRDRFTQLWLYSDGLTVWHTLSGTQLAAMTVSSMTVSSIRGDGSLLTNLNAISSLTLQSTLQGLGTIGYVSTASLLSTVAGLGTASYVSTASLVSTTASLITQIQTSGAISTPNLISTVVGLGSASYVSTLSLVSTTAVLQNQFQTAGFLSTLNLTSTVAGLGSAGYASTTFVGNAISTFSSALGPVLYLSSLQSTVQGLGSASYISTASLVSTTIGIQSQIQNSGALSTPSLISTVAGLGSAGYASTSFVGNAISTFSTALGPGGGINLINLQSTVAGLGSATYISSAQLLSTTSSYARVFQTLSASVSSLTASNIYASTLNVDNLIIGTGLGFINIGPLQATAISTIQVNTNALYANSNYFGTTSSQTALQFYGLTGSFSNTVIAEQSTGTGTQELLLYKVSSSADRIRLQTTGSIVFEPGVSARIWPAAPSNATPAMVIDTASNVGIGTAAPGSLLDVVGQGRFLTVSTQAIWASSINGSIPLNPLQLISTVSGLGSASYVSSLSLVSTTAGLQVQFQTAGFLSTPNLISTVTGLGSAGYASTTFVGNAISTFSTALGPGGGIQQSALTSSLVGLATLGYISTSQLVSTVAGLGTGGLAAIPPFLSSLTLSTGFITAMTVSSQQTLTSSISGNQSIFQTLSSQSLTVSSFFTATRQMTPMFVVF